MTKRIIRLPEVLRRTAQSRSSHYESVKQGLFVPPFAIGPRARGYGDDETDELVAARIAGRPDAEIRALVVKLIAARKSEG